MDAILLAAGKGTRMGPLCTNRPKPLLKILNRPVLEWNLEALYDFADSFIIVVGHEAEKIKNHLGDNFKGKPITYLEQKEQLGTGHALLQAEGKTKDNFFVLMGDDLYDRQCFEKLSKTGTGILGQKSDTPRNFGVIENTADKLTWLSEKPENPKTNTVNTGLCLFDGKIFDELKNIKKSPRGEIELTDAILSFSKKQPLEVVEAENSWLPLTYPWSLFDATEKKFKEMKKLIDKSAIVENGSVLKGEVFVGPNSVVKSGSYIEGPVHIGSNCVIGPNCFLRPNTAIGDNCHIGNAVEIKNSILFGKTNVSHLSYIGDSIVGENCNFGAGTITANLRLDEAPVKSTVKGQRVHTGRKKLGAIIGDNVKTGINSSIMPGVSISANSKINAHELVKRDI